MSVYISDSPVYFVDAVNSLLNQTRLPDEIIVIADGPLGNELDLAVNNFKSNKLIKILRLEKNCGLALSRKEAISKASFDIIAVMDSDDICTVNRFEKQIKLIEDKEAEVVGGWIEEFNKIPKDRGKIRNTPINYEEILFNAQNDDYAILSLSGRWDSIAMWSHYGDQHKGYCVGFYEEKMRNSKIFGMGGPVHYNKNDGFPLIRPYEWGMEKLFKMSHTKAKEWKYEKEYRLTDLLNREGLMTPQNHKQEILKIASKKSIKVYQTEKVPFKFKIKRTRIL